MIAFNVPPFVGPELDYVREAAETNHKISGDGPFTHRCDGWIEERFNAQKALLTTSGTTALEMAAILCDLKPGDEVILPSFTFSSTATAFVLVGARLVFVDVRPDTMNLDETKIEAAITDRTRVIVAVHYAGVCCDMDKIMDIAHRHGLMVVEDAAQAVMSTYKGAAAGTIADFGCYSFHETKNYSMGEGGALVIRDARHNERAEMIREKGTNRQRFLRGQVDKYTWETYGSSYLPSDLNAAYLWAQLERADQINADRLASWQDYYDAFAAWGAPRTDAESLAREDAPGGYPRLPVIPGPCAHNGHMFYLLTAGIEQRDALIAHLRSRGILAVFHYVPLHSSPAGRRYGRFDGADEHTTEAYERLVRLPMYYCLTAEDRASVVAAVEEFYDRSR